MNKKSVILNSVFTVLAFLTFLFVVVPEGFMSLTDFLQMPGIYFLEYGLPVLLALLGSLLALVAGVLGILVACNVIKNQKLAKIAAILEIVGVSLALVGYAWLLILFAIDGGYAIVDILGLVFAIAAVVVGKLALIEANKAPVAAAPEVANESNNDKTAA